jgi:hypothetical protein
MLNKKILHLKGLISVFIILIMVLSGFVAIAGAAEVNEENSTERPQLGKVVGKVINDEGEPIAGVLVVLSAITDSSDPEDAYKARQETNERGYFEFNELNRGLYILMAEMEGYHPYREEVKVPAGETVELKIILKMAEEKPEYCVVFGFVFNALENEPIHGAIVVIYNERSDIRPVKTETDEEGQFKVRLPPGKYVIEAEARGFHPYREIIGIEKNEMKLEIPLKPIHDEKPEHKRPMLSGHIFDAASDKPIFGWVELSYGNPKVEMPQPKRIERLPDREREEKEEQEREREREEEKEREHAPLSRAETDKRDVKRPDAKPNAEGKKPGDFFLWRTYSNRDGYYEYFDVPAGHYEMRVFAKGHIMYYNEINVREDPLYIDVYLRREQVKKPPMSVIAGQVVDQETKEPVAGAWVCVAPPKLIRRIIEEYKSDDPEQMSIDIDPDNIIVNTEIETEFYEDSEKEVKPGIIVNKEKIEDGKIQKPVPIKETDKKTRGEGERDTDQKRERDREKDDDRNCCEGKREQRRLLLRKFCTRTDEKGFFKLQVPAGEYAMLVKARGYEAFTHKLVIKSKQIMKVRVPLNPSSETTDEQEERAIDEGTDTMDVKSSLSSGATGLNSVLTTVLGVLTLIALIMGVLIIRKPITKFNRSKKIKVQKY